jgi:hypothetical protein
LIAPELIGDPEALWRFSQLLIGQKPGFLRKICTFLAAAIHGTFPRFIRM